MIPEHSNDLVFSSHFSVFLEFNDVLNVYTKSKFVPIFLNISMVLIPSMTFIPKALNCSLAQSLLLLDGRLRTCAYNR